MQLTTLLALAASLATTSAQVLKGFNYGSVNTDGSPITESQYENDFKTAQGLVGTSGFTSARIFTLIQGGSTNTPTEAIQAAINTKTNLLLGLWGSGGQTGIDNELAAMSAALKTYGSAFTDLIVGISVGSEDLYRISPTGIENKSGVGADPDTIVSYINQVRNALKGTGASSKPIGHVDTWTAYVNGSNAAVIAACDFIGTDFYPYFQFQMQNSIQNAYALATSAYDQTVAVAQGKPVWVTETGWPVSGSPMGDADASIANAKTYWDEVGCGRFFGQVNTFWFTLQDSFPTTPNPSFGIVGTQLSTTPLFDLSCSGSASSVPASAKAATKSIQAVATGKAGGAGAGGEASAINSGAASGQTQAPASGSGSGSGGAPAGAAPANQGSGKKTKTIEVVDTITTCPNSCPEATEAPAPAAPNTFITKTSAAPGVSGSSCPADLQGEYQYPHLIVPIDSSSPSKAGGTSYNGTISSTVSTIFDFDIPASYAGKTCSLIFLLPTQGELETSAFSLSGSGGLDVARLTSPATESTSYSSCPGVAKEFGGPSSVTPGNSYVIGSGPCNSGQKLGYKVSATGSLSLNYFQDYNPYPIGLYVTVC